MGDGLSPGGRYVRIMSRAKKPCRTDFILKMTNGCLQPCVLSSYSLNNTDREKPLLTNYDFKMMEAN